ncbi:hypothetical protein B484DRAFT_441834 [Ochromonadaceae sp. CCMP2298]|nr:hypothetical protein B484DRAFT_441834 [Ochromonadaceae sp. CCMP2298]
MPATHKATFPVVDPSPSLGRAVGNFNFTDYTTIGAFSGAGFVFGWLTARKPFRVPQSRFLAVLGVMAGVSYASLSSMQRLMGLEPNSREVFLNGALSAAELEKKEGLANIPNAALIDSDAD